MSKIMKIILNFQRILEVELFLWKCQKSWKIWTFVTIKFPANFEGLKRAFFSSVYSPESSINFLIREMCLLCNIYNTLKGFDFASASICMEQCVMKHECAFSFSKVLCYIETFWLNVTHGNRVGRHLVAQLAKDCLNGEYEVLFCLSFYKLNTAIHVETREYAMSCVDV